MVRLEGLEPPRLAPPEPKSGVSTISTTPAMNQNFINPKTCSGVPYNTVMVDENIDVLVQYLMVKLKLSYFS